MNARHTEAILRKFSNGRVIKILPVSEGHQFVRSKMGAKSLRIVGQSETKLLEPWYDRGVDNLNNIRLTPIANHTIRIARTVLGRRRMPVFLFIIA